MFALGRMKRVCFPLFFIFLMLPSFSSSLSLCPSSVLPRTIDQILFTFHDPVTLLGLSPISGPDTGETVVTIYGESFPMSTAIECIFRSTVDNDRNEVDGVYVNSSTIICARLKSFGGEGAYDVSVSLNGVEESTASGVGPGLLLNFH